MIYAHRFPAFTEHFSLNIKNIVFQPKQLTSHYISSATSVFVPVNQASIHPCIVPAVPDGLILFNNLTECLLNV